MGIFCIITYFHRCPVQCLYKSRTLQVYFCCRRGLGVSCHWLVGGFVSNGVSHVLLCMVAFLHRYRRKRAFTSKHFIQQQYRPQHRDQIINFVHVLRSKSDHNDHCFSQLNTHHTQWVNYVHCSFHCEASRNKKNKIQLF
ncbi:unnamed protein product [Pylaiella littoralis]